jgi:hypothetical protein
LNNTHDHTIPLNELLAQLKANGYALTIEQILEIQTILLSSSLSNLATSDLKYIITPVIAKNEEDQHDIYEIIDSWVAEKTSAIEPAPGRFRRWLKDHSQLVFALKVAGLLLAVSVAILLYIFTTRRNQTPEDRVLRGKLYVDTAITQLIDSSPKKPTIPAQGNATANQPSKPGRATPPANTGTDIGLEYVRELQNPIQPSKVDNRLPITLVFGFLMGAILFHIVSYEKRKRMELEKRKRTEDAFFTIPEKEDRNNFVYPYNEVEQLQQLNLQFSNRDHLIHRPGRLQKVKHILQTPAYVENPAIDIKASINKSVREAGLATIVTESEWLDRKYIFICERKAQDAHMTWLLDYVVKHVKAANPNVIRYNYSDDIMVLEDINERPITLKQLAFLYPHHHVIIIGNCNSFFELDNLLLKEDILEPFGQWAFKAIITPVPLPDWSYMEEQLQDNGFHIVPAEIEGIEQLTKAIIEDAAIKKELLMRSLGDMYSVSKFDFRYIDQLKAYLNNEQLFQAVCALAVYPFLKWPITLTLFAAFEKSWPGFVLSYDNLLKVARIPWLHTGRLDQAIRLQLLDALDTKTEIMARETIVKMLDEMKSHTPHGSPAFTELQVQYNINAFFLYSHDQLQYKRYAGVKEVIGYYWNNLDEWELKEHVNRKSSGLIPGSQAKVTAAVEEFVVQEKQYEKQNIRLAKISVVILPAALLFILFTVFKPAIVYMEDSGQKVSVSVIIKKDTNCRQSLVKADIGNEATSVSKELSFHNDADTLQISDIGFNTNLRLQLYTDKGSIYTLSIPAAYSNCNLITRCREMRN